MSKGVKHKYPRFLGDPLCALSGYKYGRLLQRTSSRNTGDSGLGGELLQSIIELVFIEQIFGFFLERLPIVCQGVVLCAPRTVQVIQCFVH